MYNTKYLLKYCNRYGTPLRIELQIRDYVGETFLLVNQNNENAFLQNQDGAYITSNIDGEYIPERDTNPIEGGANPFTLEYHNDFDEVGEKAGAIRATSADMEFYENLLFNIDDLATSDETEIRCVFYYDDRIEWIGFVMPDFFNVQITENPLINLTVTDRIGVLKSIPYKVGSFITQKIRILDIITNILKETGLELNINVVCGLYSDQFEPKTGDGEFESWEKNNPLYDTWVNEYRLVKDLDTMETMNCYEVLQRIMNQFNCLIAQYKGEWWIVNKFDLDNGKGVRFVYDFEGEFQAMERIVFTEEYFNLIDKGGQRTLIPAGAKNTYVLDNGNDMIYPLNHSIHSETQSLGGVTYWQRNEPFSFSTMENLIPAIYNSNGEVDQYYINQIKELMVYDFITTPLASGIDKHAPVPFDAPVNSWILESQKFELVTMGKKRTAFKLIVDAVGKPQTGIMLGVFLEIEKKDNLGVKTYHSLTNPLNADMSAFTGNWYWLQVSSIEDSSIRRLAPFNFENKHEDLNNAVEQRFEVSNIIPAGFYENYELSTGKMFIRIYPNRAYTKEGYNQDLVFVNNCIKSIMVEFENDDQNPKGTIFQSLLTNKNFTKERKERTVLFGDYQTVGQNGFFYQYREDSLSIQYNNNGEMLKDWFTPYDSERNPLLIHSLRQLTYSYGKAHDELRIGFDMNRINPFSHFAVRCFSERYIQVNPEDDYLQEKDSKYITASVGKYLNNKRFTLIGGKIDYLRSRFEGLLAQIRTDRVDTQEYIYSYFNDSEINNNTIKS